MFGGDQLGQSSEVATSGARTARERPLPKRKEEEEG
jgi:hypothetical protein